MPAANPAAAAPRPRLTTEFAVEDPVSTLTPWSTPTTRIPTAKLQANPTAMNATRSRRGLVVDSNANTAATPVGRSAFTIASRIDSGLTGTQLRAG